MKLRFGSVCSGIEAASVAWNTLGWEAAWFSEIEPFPCAVLAHHFPDVPNAGDMTKLPEMILSGEVEAPDMLCGGTPCQAFSVAGNRKSLDDDRGNLSLIFCEVANAIDAARLIQRKPASIIFWENVPGVLSTRDNAFGCFLAELVGASSPLLPGTTKNKWPGAGYVAGPKRQAAWRILDAQYFGVPQRRRRVFVVASARDGVNPGKILFEPESGQRDFEPRRKAGQGASGEFENCTRGTSTSFTQSSFAQYTEGVETVKASGGDLGGGSETLVVSAGMTDSEAILATGQDVVCCLTSKWAKGTGGPAGDEAYNLVLMRENVVQETEMILYENHAQDARYKEKDICPTITSRYGTGGGNVPLIGPGKRVMNIETRVRKLTPVECERLQGFPDNWTRIPYRGKSEEDCPDSPRYRAIGNSWAVPVVRWIGKRIKQHINEQ